MIYTEPKIEYGYGFEWNERELIINDGVDDISILLLWHVLVLLQRFAASRRSRR